MTGAESGQSHSVDCDDQFHVARFFSSARCIVTSRPLGRTTRMHLFNTKTTQALYACYMKMYIQQGTLFGYRPICRTEWVTVKRSNCWFLVKKIWMASHTRVGRRHRRLVQSWATLHKTELNGTRYSKIIKECSDSNGHWGQCLCWWWYQLSLMFCVWNFHVSYDMSCRKITCSIWYSI